MSYHLPPVAVLIFGLLFAMVPSLCYLLAGGKDSSFRSFAARCQRHWFVNGLAFATDYFSIATFLGICGLIAFYGYDGFLYAIGLIAGWAAALWVITPRFQRLGKFTLASALASRFDSSGVRLAAASSILVVCLFCLMLEFIAAATLLKPLIGLNDLHWANFSISGLSLGIAAAGAFFTLWAITASLASTVWLQAIRAVALMIFFATFLPFLFAQGFTAKDQNTFPRRLTNIEFAAQIASHGRPIPLDPAWLALSQHFYRLKMNDGTISTWLVTGQSRVPPSLDWPSTWVECETISTNNGQTLINGQEPSTTHDLLPVNFIHQLPGDVKPGTPLNATSFMAGFQGASIAAIGSTVLFDHDTTTTLYYSLLRAGSEILSPGGHPTLFPGLRNKTLNDRFNFFSLMLALFCGAAALPHLFTRYYAADNHATARKSAVVGVIVIGIFCLLTLYVGMSAMAFAPLDPSNSNLAAPLLARTSGSVPFGLFSAIAWIGILGTAPSLIGVASTAITGSLLPSLLKTNLDGHAQVRTGKITALAIGLVAVVLGIFFQQMNLAFLLGWAFNVAASANLPAITLGLFWKRATKEGITASIFTGLFSSLLWIFLSADAFTHLYGKPGSSSPIPFNQPALVTIPLAYLALIVVSLLTRKAERPTSPGLNSDIATGR